VWVLAPPCARNGFALGADFSDLTITRLGANTVFSFNRRARQVDLGSGAILVHSPASGPKLKIAQPRHSASLVGRLSLNLIGLADKNSLMLEGSAAFIRQVTLSKL